MKEFKSPRIIAIAITLLFHIAVVLILVYSFLHYSWPPKDIPPPPKQEILFGGEYVMLGNIQEPANNEMDNSAAQESEAETPVESVDTENAGDVGEQAPLISTDKESTMKVEKKEKPQKTGTTKKEKEEQERIKRDKEKAEKINKRVAFNSNGSGGGKQGSPEGNADVGLSRGAPGHSLSGRTLESWGKPSSSVDGTVIIEVRVDARGRVVSARYSGGSGSAAASRAVRNSCEQASKSSRFSVSTKSTEEQVGRITWKFE